MSRIKVLEVLGAALGGMLIGLAVLAIFVAVGMLIVCAFKYGIVPGTIVGSVLALSTGVGFYCGLKN